MRVAALLACVLLVPAAAGDWAKFHGDDRNTGFAPGTAYQVPTETWWTSKAENNAQAKASPILKDNVLLTASAAGLIQALDSRTGKELWRHQMEAGVEGTGAIAGERAYVVDKNGNLKALNLRDGRVEHTAGVGATLGSITEHEGKLFIGNEAGEMRAYLSSTLTLLWTFKLSDIRLTATFAAATGWTCTSPVTAQPIRGAPAVFGGKVFFGALNHYVVALAEDGNGDGKTSIRWVHKTDDIVVGAPTIATHLGTTRVVVGSYDGYVRAYLPTAFGEGDNTCHGAIHTPNWSFQVPDPVGDTTARGAKVHSSPANDGAKVYFGTNTGRVYALDGSNGNKLWETVAGSNLEPVTSSPAIANGIVTVGSENKKVYWMSAANGSVLRTVDAPSAVGSSPAIDGAMAFVAATDGTLFAFGPTRPKQADLQPGDGSLTTTLMWLTVRNAGEAASVPTKLTYTRDGQPWISFDLPAIQPGGEARLERAVAEQQTTNHYVLAIDPDNLVPEKDEANNIVEFDYTILPGTPASSSTTAAPPAETTSEATSESFDIPSAWTGLPVVALLVVAALARRRR